MEVGRFYLQKRNYTGAINRFRDVVAKYQTTRHVEEALQRLTEAYMALGIVNEAQTAAAVLGHNFPDSPWYKDAYALLTKGGLEPRERSGSWISKAFRGVPRGRPEDWVSLQPCMLVQLAIRDIVLIDRLELHFHEGLSVLTGETGRRQVHPARRLRAGARRARRRRPRPPRRGAGAGHGGLRLRRRASRPPHCAEADIDTDGDLILRRVQFADGRTRAFVNDQPVSVQVLRAIGAALVEIHGQHDDRALVDPVTPPRDPRRLRRLAGEAAQAVADAARPVREAQAALNEHRARIERRARRPISCATPSRNWRASRRSPARRRRSPSAGSS